MAARLEERLAGEIEHEIEACGSLFHDAAAFASVRRSANRFSH
jgi:hypothetical protein